MPTKKKNSGAIVSCGGGRKRSISSFKSTVQLVDEAKQALQKSRLILGQMVSAKRRRKITEKEKKEYNAYRREIVAKRKAAPALKDPIDKVLVKYWKKNKTRFRNRNEFYLAASKELKIPQIRVRARTPILIEAGLIIIKTSTKRNTPKPHLADNSKIYLTERQREVIRQSSFSLMSTSKLIREVRKILRKPSNTRTQLVEEAMLVYRAKTGRTDREFLLEMKA